MKKTSKKAVKKDRLGKQAKGLFASEGQFRPANGAANRNGDQFSQECPTLGQDIAKHLRFAKTYGASSENLRKLIFGSEIESRKRREALASQLLLVCAGRADLAPTAIPEIIEACILSAHEFYDQFETSMKKMIEVRP